MTDGRLLLPAGAAWLGAAVAAWRLGDATTLVARHGAAMVVLAGAAVVLAAGLAIGVAALRSRGEVSLLVGMTLAFLAVGALATAARTAVWTADPLAGWVDHRATAVVQGTVATEPILREARGGAAWGDARWWEVRLSTEVVSARGAQVGLRVPVMLRLPQAGRAPPPGSRIAVGGRLGPARDASGAAARLVAGPAATWVLVEAPRLPDRAAQAMRAGLRASLQQAAPEPRALVAGLSIGDESGAPPDLTAAMRSSGLSHLTAVSGGNVAIVLGAVLIAATLLRLSLLARVVAAVVALGYFVLLVGPEPSVLRASVMGAVAVTALLVGGRRGGPSILATGVLVLVVAQPALAMSWAFALSAFATAGLILLAPGILAWTGRWALTARWPMGLRHALALTLAAQLSTLPVLVAMGGASGWVAVPANLAAMPAVAPVTVLGLVAAALSPVLPGAAAVVAQAAAWPAGWIATVAHVCANLPAGGVPLPGGWPGLAWLVAAAASAAVLRIAWHRLPPWATTSGMRIVLVAAASLGAVAMAALPPDRRGWPPSDWLLIMCDVGQGDAVLIRAGDASAVVVDAGPSPDLVDGCLADAGVRAVPAVILTHFHADHVRGLAGVIRGRSVAQVLATPVREPGEEAAAADAVLAGAGLRAEPVTAGDHRVIGDLDLRLLWPRRRISTESVPNNASIVLVATIRGRRLLLTGDIEPPAQSAVAVDLRGAPIDVIKVPHHGSRFQSSLLPVWAPASIALVSVGADNDYGHPADETIAAWSRAGALIARTDQQGDVAVVDTGERLGVVTRR